MSIVSFAEARNPSISSLPVAQFSNNVAKFNFGSLQGNDTLEALRIYNGTVIQYGIDRLANDTNTLLRAANTLLAMQVDPLVEITAERFVRNSEAQYMAMEDLAANSIPTAQKINPRGSDAGYPLRRKGIGLQWNAEYWRTKEVRQYAMQLQALLTADSNAVALEIRKAFFRPTNYTFNDFLEDSYALPVKALLNADGLPLPPNEYGTTFNDAAHTHYMFPGSGNGDTIATYTSAAWSTATSIQKNADVEAVLQNLREHYIDGKAMILTCPTDQSQWMAPFVSNTSTGGPPTNFQRLEYIETVPGTYRDHVDQQKYGTIVASDQFNRKLGYFEGAEVWIKPWVPAGYMVAYIEGQDKPICLRVPKGGDRPGTREDGSYSLGEGDLRLVYQYQSYPLYAQAMVRDFGTATWNRVNGVAFQISATSYTSPV